jgi:hypothetical protein
VIKRLAQLAGALMLLCIFRTELAALILFTLVFVLWLIFIVCAWALGACVEAIPAILKSLIPSKSEETCEPF